MEDRHLRKHTGILVLIICVMLLAACGQSTPKNEGYEDLRDYFTH